jgi:TM2 domain-containing membrane protein YozV
MNDQPDANVNPQPFIAFCQNCGKSLDSITIRKVGTAIYCEPCLESKLHAVPPPNPAGTPPPYAKVNFVGTINGQPINPGEPNPGLAALLGLIPGVGAMYNEQYAKGVAHLVIFAVLVMFTHISGIFIMFVFGWMAYMSIEAHHTARARRDGTPLPNPFGFNDIGERMGFGAAWPNADPAAAARDAVNTAAEAVNAATAQGFSRPPIVTPPPAGQPAAPWGAPADSYSQPFTQPYAPYANPNPAPPYAPPYTATPYQPVSNVVPPFVTPSPAAPLPTPSRFPTGAVVLIALGMLFLLGTMGIFNSLPGFSLVGMTLLALGVWIFLRRMTETGQSLADDGSPNYKLRLLSAIKGPIWFIVIGILIMLHAFRLISWDYTWPFLIILAGVLMILQRAVYNSAVYPGAPFSTGGPIAGQGGVSFAEANDRPPHQATTPTPEAPSHPETPEGSL